jgi:twitching motility protein PilT
MDAALAAMVRAGRITQRAAEAQSSTPDELKRILGAASLQGGSNYGAAA